MPIYEHECPKCENVSEHWAKMNDPVPEKLDCKLCDYEGPMKRLISRPAPPQFAGKAGIKRQHALLRQRNEEYRKTQKYKDERVHNVERAHKRLGVVE